MVEQIEIDSPYKIYQFIHLLFYAWTSRWAKISILNAFFIKLFFFQRKPDISFKKILGHFVGAKLNENLGADRMHAGLPKPTGFPVDVT